MGSVLFSAQARKAWAGLIGAVAGTAAARWGLDVSGCSDAIGDFGTNALSYAIPAVVSLAAVFHTPNKEKA